MMQRREFVESLARDNREFYGTPDGRAALAVFERTFEHSWIYVFELVQNALDADARSVAFRLSEDGHSVIFQHDGAAPIEEPEVEGLSKIFRSTKGAASVGFMGIGFKSVFGRFREARISGWGWTFRYEIDQSVGEEYGDVQTDPLGAVMPIWDQGIECPEEGFTTRFELRMPRDESVDLSADLGRFVSNDDLTLLAILGESGLERLDVDGSVWDLGVDRVDDGTMTAIARAGGAVHRWQLFSVEFQPSPGAIRRFLEYRRIQPRKSEREKVYEQAARKRRVLGVLPLDDRSVPVPPERGRIYATLPTEITLPFGIHVNADWLLNISRMGLGEIEDAWQREIVDRIADVLARVLDWVSRACSAPDTIKAAFAVLASPSSEAGGIEAILAEEQWLSGLHEVLRDRAILPVWAERSNSIAFAKPNETLVPPTPLADAFEEEPALGPAVLLDGPVLAQPVLGSGAARLLRRIDLLRPMTSGDLERAWAGGLQNWWRQLDAEQSARRDLLFRVWGALAMLAPEGDWSTESLRCVRTESGQWQSACESAFMNEYLPSDDEPGGIETRRLLTHQFSPTPDRRVADAWIRTLRGSQQPGAANQQRHLLAAREWIETHARSIGLQEMVESAIDALMASPTPDWDVLVPFGCWAMHRNRLKLLTHVVVDENGKQRGVAIGDALLADPYVRPDATGRGRRLLFPGAPAISAKYLDTVPDDVLKWRTFFEDAGAKGALSVRPVTTTTWEKSHVAAFLGLEAERIGKSTSVYTLQDFDIHPVLPEKNASSKARAAVAAWLDDGFRVLRDKGRRQAKRFYYTRHSLHGANPSTWVVTLSELEWVPCSDRLFRRPDDVLPRSDPARRDVPVAELSPELVGALEREGMNFGTRIPEVTALQRLESIGSQLSANELAKLLRDVRAQVSTDEDKRRFKRAASELLVQSHDRGRIPVGRVVRRVGGGHRGALGGWITPMSHLHEGLRHEFEHPEFPVNIPETTTGDQALDYILDVWARARSSPERLANSVREVLPLAYSYCLEECSDDSVLSERWANVVSAATVFTDREWIAVADANNVFYDDVEDRRFIPDTARVRTVTSGHLGSSASDQKRTASALHLPFLSTSVKIEWFGDEGKRVDDWIPRLDVVCSLLHAVRGVDAADGDRSATKSMGTELRISSKLAVKVSIGSSPAECVPVNARLHDGVLTVSGRPVQFGAEAAKELLRDFSFRQRGDLAADLTGMLTVINDRTDFDLAVDKFRRSFAPDFDIPIRGRAPATDVEAVLEVERPSATQVLQKPSTTRRHVESKRTAPVESPAEPIDHTSIRSDDIFIVDSRPSDSHAPEDMETKDPSFTRDRALARQRRLAQELKDSLKAEIAPSEDEHASRATKDPGPDARERHSDEVYRRVAAQYERELGREPELGDAYQQGWDLRSVDPATGTKRLIEVKGKGRLWDNNEVVELSRAQIHKAFAMSGGKDTGLWYLYVVERMDDGSYSVLPIENPVDVAGKWILCGGSWRMIADEPRKITIE